MGLQMFQTNIVTRTILHYLWATWKDKPTLCNEVVISKDIFWCLFEGKVFLYRPAWGTKKKTKTRFRIWYYRKRWNVFFRSRMKCYGEIEMAMFVQEPCCQIAGPESVWDLLFRKEERFNIWLFGFGRCFVCYRFEKDDGKGIILSIFLKH